MQQRPGDFLRRARKGVPPEDRAEAGTGGDSLGLHQVELTNLLSYSYRFHPFPSSSILCFCMQLCVAQHVEPKPTSKYVQVKKQWKHEATFAFAASYQSHSLNQNIEAG